MGCGAWCRYLTGKDSCSITSEAAARAMDSFSCRRVCSSISRIGSSWWIPSIGGFRFSSITDFRRPAEVCSEIEDLHALCSAPSGRKLPTGAGTWRRRDWRSRPWTGKQVSHYRSAARIVHLLSCSALGNYRDQRAIVESDPVGTDLHSVQQHYLS